MAKAKVRMDFTTKPVPVKIQYGRDRVVDITGNGNFTTPEPPLADITNACSDLETKYNAAQGGGTSQTTAMKASEKVWDNKMRQLANYVTRIADGDVVIITSAGFTPTQTEPSPIGVPDKVENLTAKHGEQAGTVITNCNVVKNTKGYVTILTNSSTLPLVTTPVGVVLQSDAALPAGVFVLINTSTNRKATFNNLVSGTRYFIRKYAFNAAGKGADSDAVSIVAP